jgi:ubiquinone/menaquinone biosynthesis C-methylase UbiE
MDDPREGARLESKVDPGAWVEKYLRRHVGRGAEVLSVGCGPGMILRAVAALDPTIRATGVDISLERVHEAFQKCSRNPQVNFVCGDAQELQFSSNRFDVVYCRMLMQYLREKERAVAEIARVCKPGGTVLLQDLDGQLVWHYPEEPVMQRTVETVIHALAGSGFDPFVGRKLFWLARKAGLQNVDVQVECYHLIAGEVAPHTLQQWELKLEIIRPRLANILGSYEKAEEATRRFLDYLRRPDTLTYSNVFTVTGRKPF